MVSLSRIVGQFDLGKCRDNPVPESGEIGQLQCACMTWTPGCFGYQVVLVHPIRMQSKLELVMLVPSRFQPFFMPGIASKKLLEWPGRRLCGRSGAFCKKNRLFQS
jgi:hypothetical protein